MIKKYLTTKDVSAMIQTSTRQLFRWRSEGKIRYIQIGKKVLFDPNDVETFVQEYAMEKF